MLLFINNNNVLSLFVAIQARLSTKDVGIW